MAGRKRLFLAGVLVLAVVLGALVQAERLDTFVVLLVLPLSLLALAALATYRYHSACARRASTTASCWARCSSPGAAQAHRAPRRLTA